jgi:zinc protease
MVDYVKKILDNGLTVVVHEDTTSPLVAINILYKVGSKDEDKDKTGITHLFEHLMFGGSANVPDFDEPIQLAGGENNAFTNADITNYYNILPIENIEIGMWIEADRMAKLKLTAKGLTTQKKVVIEEFKETCLNEPYGDMLHQISAMCYANHGYEWPTIGKDIAHVERIDMDDAKAFYKNFYCPQNAILVLCGNTTTSDGFALAQKWFGHISPGLPYQSTKGGDEKITFQSKIIHANVPSKAIYLAFKMKDRLHPDYYVADLITDILSSGRSSRFYQFLIKEAQLFSHLDAFISGTTDAGLLTIEGRLMDNVSIDEAREAIWIELEKMKQDILGERELEKIKNKAESHLIFSEIGIMNKAMSLAYYEYLGDIDLINREVDLYDAVSLDDIQRVSHDLFNRDGYAELIYLPIE